MTCSRYKGYLFLLLLLPYLKQFLQDSFESILKSDTIYRNNINHIILKGKLSFNYFMMKFTAKYIRVRKLFTNSYKIGIRKFKHFSRSIIISNWNNPYFPKS